MAHEVKMPQMGESIAEGTVTTWLKKVGDAVERDEPLFEVATDKVDAEIPSPASGTLTAIKAEPGSTVAVGAIVAVIAEAGESQSAAPPAAKEQAAPAPAAPQQAPKAAAPAPAAPAPMATSAASPAPASATPPSPAPQADGERPHKSSPLVRRMAQEHQVDLAHVAGSGVGGRITKEDMQAHLGGASAGGGHAPRSMAETTTSATSGGPTPAAAPQASHGDEAFLPKPMAGDRIEDLAGMRRQIAVHMSASKRISPHVATVWEMDFTHIGKLRQKFKKTWEDRFGVNLTYTAFILKVATDALKEFPALNASINGNKVYYHSSVNMGVAVALDWGLIVPVVHGADELNTLGIQRRAADLAARARNKKLKPDEIAGGTFTVSNPGALGPMFNVPIINQPQVAILGVGTVEKRPVIVDDMIAIRTRAYMSLSFDHRLIDGALADQFMGRIKKGLETFDEGSL